MSAGRPAGSPSRGHERYVFVVGGLHLGGAERHAFNVARHLAETRGVAIEMWGLRGPEGGLADLCRQHGIPVRVVPFEWTWARHRLISRLVRFGLALRAAAPSVIVASTPIANTVCGIMWRLSGARAFVWNQRDEGLDHLGGRWHRFAVRNTPAFITNCDAGRDYLVNRLGAKTERIVKIRNGVALPGPRRSRGAWRQSLGIPEATPVAVMVANITAFKDHETLVRAWRHVVDGMTGGPPPVLLLAGKELATAEHIKALAFDLHLGDALRFLGKVDDVMGLLGAADLGVFSSRSEGCPNGVLECMAAGLAVAGTDIPGIREAVGPEGAAFLAPAGDAPALAGRMLGLLRDGDLRISVGERNRQRIATTFSFDVMQSETERVLFV